MRCYVLRPGLLVWLRLKPRRLLVRPRPPRYVGRSATGAALRCAPVALASSLPSAPRGSLFSRFAAEQLKKASLVPIAECSRKSASREICGLCTCLLRPDRVQPRIASRQFDLVYDDTRQRNYMGIIF